MSGKAHNSAPPPLCRGRPGNVRKGRFPWGSEAGLLTQETDQTNPITRTYDPLARITAPTTYQYDTLGQRTAATTTPLGGQDTTTRYGYDAAGRLTAATLPNGDHDTHITDGGGLRATTTHTINGASTTDTYAWDPSGGLPLLLADATNTYLYGLGSSPYAQINRDTGQITYRHADQLGSTRTTTNTTGDTTGTWTYDTYGNQTTHTGTTTTPFQYAGQYRDTTTGLYYLRARSYDPATGQFLTPDPLITLTRTPYAYTSGNPRQHADPTGLIDGATCTWWLLSCGGLDEDITGSTTITTVNFGRGATDGLTDTIANRISPGPSCTIDNTSLQARTSQALGFTATMLPASITTGRAAAATRNTTTTTTRTATETARAAEGTLSPTLQVGERSFIYGDRVLARAVEENGSYHNFPSSFDSHIISQSTRTEVSEGYVKYTLRGNINGVDGVYEIGARPSGLADAEVITHRFFRPGG